MSSVPTEVVLPALSVVLGLLLFGRFRGLPAERTTPTSAGRVIVVVPARDEALTLPGLLGDLEASSLRAEVVVVDDDSSDDTATVAGRFEGVQVVRSGPPPVGWCGKNWACHRGVEHVGALADGDTLVFIDADVRVHPDALGTAVAAREELGGVVSVQPYHLVPSAVEQLSAVFNVVSVMAIGAGTARPSGMYGPLICMRAGDYRTIGGHAAVRGILIDDMALAARCREADVPVRVFGGRDLVRFRMYPRGLAQLWEGWTKNIAAGAASTSPLRSILVVAWVALTLSSAAALPGGGWTELAGAAVVAVGMWVLLRRVGAFRWWAAVGYPVLFAFFVVVFVWSLAITFGRRRVRWKGRRVPTALPSRSPGT